MRTESYKLLVKLGSECKLYNILNDPHESENLYFKEPEVSKELSDAFVSYFRENFRPMTEETIELTQEEKEKLKSLGYAF